MAQEKFSEPREVEVTDHEIVANSLLVVLQLYKCVTGLLVLVVETGYSSSEKGTWPCLQREPKDGH